MEWKWFNQLSGYKRKVYSVTAFFISGLICVIFFYIIWYNSNKKLVNNKAKVFELSSKDFIRDSISEKYYLNPKINLEDTLSSGDKYIPSITNWNSFKLFMEENSGSLGVFFAFFGFFSIVIGFYNFGKYEKFLGLFFKSKERIKILDRFSIKTNSLFNERSVYKCIIDLLDRCLEETYIRHNKGKIIVKMLLCSPLVDSDGRVDKSNLKDWGNEFTDLIHSLANSTNKVTLEIYHLPNEVISGVNPLKNFTEVLVNYISDKEEDFNEVWKSTLNNIDRMQKLDDNNTNVKLNKTKLNDVPFQIIIAKSPLLEEVVVSFAGKTNLENVSTTENQKQEPIGFHSVDPIVVEAFETIFTDYVRTKQRVPIKPQHTANIIKKINENTVDITVNSYLKSVNGDIFSHLQLPDVNIKVTPRTFSPAIANSSKFTSRVIQESINKDDIFLEIGAGSGVQTIIAYHTIQCLGNSTPDVHAIELINDAYELLIENAKANNIYTVDASDNRISGIYAYKAELKDNSTLTEYGQIKATLSGKKFSYIVADLPFVNTKCNDAIPLEKGFFDPSHNLQKSLLNFFANDKDIIDENAKLITAFSSLGGDIDILTFEMEINKANLKSIKKTSFVEAGYEWLTYIIMREKSVNESYWWNNLNVKAT